MVSRTEDTVLDPIRESAAVADRYLRRILTLLRAMHRETLAAVRRQYESTPPELAQDERHRYPEAGAGQTPEGFTGTEHVGRGAWRPYWRGEPLGRARATRERAEAVIADHQESLSPADDLNDAVQKMKDRWIRKFDAAAEKIAEQFAAEAEGYSTTKMKRIMREAGWTVKFQPSPAQRDVLDATVHQSVSLIRSIPQRYFTQIEGMVQRSVQRGGDLGQLSKELQREFGVTKRRAALIARDQNRKATSSLQRARQLELGVEEAIWVHSHAGKVPRPSHKKNDGKRYDVRRGWYDPDEKKWIQPGELINCRCFSRAVLPGAQR